MNHIPVQKQVACLPIAPEYTLVPVGLTIAEMAGYARVATVGTRAWVRGKRYQWEPVPDEMWQHVRPRHGAEVRFTYRPHGGGSRNQLFATIALVALTIVAPQFGAAASSAALGAGLTAGTAAFIGSAVSAGVVLGGSLIVNKLFAPDVQPFDAGQKRDNSKAYAEVSTDINPFGKEAYLPLVVGSRRIAPPDVTQPYVYEDDGGISTIERLFGMWGKHSITEVRVNNTSVTDFAAITTATLDGSEAAGTYTFVDKITKTENISETLSTFTVQEGTVLEDQTTPSNSEPRWFHFSTPGHDRLEEVSIKLQIQGLYRTLSETDNVYLPLRIQFRPKGGGSGDWVSLPEIHFRGRTTNVVRQEIRFRWDEEFGDLSLGGEVSHWFWATVPAVTAYTLSDGSTGPQWQCDAHFDDGGNRDTANIYSRRRGIDVVLDEATFPKGALEWRIMRGLVARTSFLGTTNYETSGVVESRFLGRRTGGNWDIDADQTTYPAQISVTQSLVIADEQPVQLPGIALLALRSRGQNAQGVTCTAARYVMDWDGAAWATETAASRNPATHYRQILYDFLTYHGIDTDLIDNDAFVAWRQECIDRGYECNAIFAGDGIGDILSALATAGFARRVFSDTFSIEYFRDRSGDTPVQLFSYRNSKIDFSIAGADRQAGLRVAFDNEDNDFFPDEVEVRLDNAADVGSYEAFSYRAITNVDLIRRRAYFDLLQIDKQRRTWIVDTAIEGVACQMGDLVSVVSDLFDDYSNGVRVSEVLSTTQIRVDQSLSVSNNVTWASDPAIDDIFDVGENTLIFIHTATGIEQRTITDITDDVITMDSPVTCVVGTIASVTTLSNAEHRCIVLRIERLDEERARLTLVDEAPEIYEELTRKFG